MVNYIFNPDLNTVTMRDTGKIIIPNENDSDPDYLDYISWISLGNQPDVETTMTQLRQSIWEETKKERDLRKNAGVFADNYWFHTDVESRIQQLGLIILGQNLPAGIMWKTLDRGSVYSDAQYVEMTPLLAQSIFSSTLLHDSHFHAVCEEHRKNIAVSTDPENYDYKVGWPPSYLDAV